MTRLKVVLKLARTLVEERWEQSGVGDWSPGDPTGWRRRFDVSSAIVYAAHFLRADDRTRQLAMAAVESVTEDERPVDPRTKERKPLHGWNAQQTSNETVLAAIDRALARTEP